ncbi:AAA domain [Caudoviricetes sp.]|nr:AAA domain [Caudoviricetes sp.]
MVTITNTKDLSKSGKVKIFAYGKPGTKKTYAIHTLPKPVIISAEGGLLSLREFDIPVIEVRSLEDVYEACEMIEKSNFESVAIDSISEIAALLLEKEEDTAKAAVAKKDAGKTHDGRAPYNELLKKITKLVRKFRDLPMHVYMIAKAEKVTIKDEGKIKWGPSLPGSKLGDALSHEFDEVFAARMELNKEGQPCYFYMTLEDGEWSARDRSGVLARYEQQDLTMIINKIMEARGE